MQLDFLQKDLFSEALEPLATPRPKKSRSTKQAALPLTEPAAPKAAKTKVSPSLVSAEEPVVVAMEQAPQPKAQSKAETAPDEKAPGAFKTISEAAEFLGLPQHVLRFWESRFSQIKPMKMRGGRRYYRPEDIDILSTIKHLLYKQGYTINGAKKAFSQGKNVLIQNMQAEALAEAQAAAPKPRISEKQKSQLTAIRQELFVLREQLKPYLAQHA